MKVLVEEIVDSTINIVEEVGQPRKYYIEGIFMQADIKNRNGRVYPKGVLCEAVDVYRKTHMAKGNGYGELGHPTTPGIHFKEVCILTQDIVEEGNNFRGRAKVIDTPAGRIVKTLIDEGCTMAVSSRGTGDIKNSIVQKGFRLVTAVDVVADPSAPDAFTTALVEEKEWVMENGVLVEKDLEELRQSVLSANRNHLKEVTESAYKTFMEKLLSSANMVKNH